jgi:hypothetical protein
VKLVNRTSSFDNNPPQSRDDQAVLGSDGVNNAPDQLRAGSGTYGNGGVHDWNELRQQTVIYSQRTMTLNDVHIYHISGNRWVSMNCVVGGMIPHERMGHTATPVGEDIYVFGGWTLEQCPVHKYLNVNQTLPCSRSYNDMHVLRTTAASTLNFDDSCNVPFPPASLSTELPADQSTWNIRSMPTSYVEQPRHINWEHLNPKGTVNIFINDCVQTSHFFLNSSIFGFAGPAPAERCGHTASYAAHLDVIVVFGGQRELPSSIPSDNLTLSTVDSNELFAYSVGERILITIHTLVIEHINSP